VLPSSTQIRGFKLGRNHQDFSGQNNRQYAFLRRRSKAVGLVLHICGKGKSLNVVEVFI